MRGHPKNNIAMSIGKMMMNIDEPCDFVFSDIPIS
jgi:hypothetical protein